MPRSLGGFRLRPRSALLAALLLSPAVLAATAAGEPGPPCPAFLLAGIGLVCREGDGYSLWSERGEYLGPTHGPDPVPLDPAPPVLASAGSARGPVCVDAAPGAYYIQVIYARAYDDADTYTSTVDALRNAVAASNGMVFAAAEADGGAVNLRIRCVDNVVHVANEALPTRRGMASFTTIYENLKARGYDDPRVKYWVYYDDTMGCACAGMGHRYVDERLTLENFNNGAPGTVPMYAVSFGRLDVRVLLHELAHTLGAVQNTAPRGTGAGHCVDGKDVMCYNDGGARGGAYTDRICSVEVFDCGRNDYFSVAPKPTGSTAWLASHWNLGSTLVRYTQHGGPVVTGLACPAEARISAVIECAMQATGSGSVDFRVAWGDGATGSAGPVAPGAVATATHAFATEAVRTLRVLATDATGKRSPVATATVVVECPLLREGDLLVGTFGAPLTGISRAEESGIPAACGGRGYTLGPAGPELADDFDVCWFAGATRLRCDRAGGPESGAIPADADRAEIEYFLGATRVGGRYRLASTPLA